MDRGELVFDKADEGVNIHLTRPQPVRGGAAAMKPQRDGGAHGAYDSSPPRAKTIAQADLERRMDAMREISGQGASSARSLA